MVNAKRFAGQIRSYTELHSGHHILFDVAKATEAIEERDRQQFEAGLEKAAEFHEGMAKILGEGIIVTVQSKRSISRHGEYARLIRSIKSSAAQPASEPAEGKKR